MMADPNRWRGRRVLITGHTGFKGAWLCLWLERLGAVITGFGLPPHTRPSLFDALGLAARISHLEGDVRDLTAVRSAVRQARAEVVFHLAAQPLVRASYRDPKTTFDINVGGTVNLLEALRRDDQARVLVNVTSDKCYTARPDGIWGHRECDPLGGGDPYSASKACAELVFAAYQDAYFPPDRLTEHGLGTASVRAGNVIGGGDWSEDRLVPDCIRALAAGRPIRVRAPHSIRPWQHVLEPLSGYLLLAERLSADPARSTGAWNFGPSPDSCRPVSTVVEQLLRVWGSGAWEDASEATKSRETPTLRLSSDKARSLLGWRPRWGFAQTVRLTANWYHDFAADPDSAEYLCQRQLDRYEQPARRRAPAVQE